jgi:hypothetical protein
MLALRDSYIIRLEQADPHYKEAYDLVYNSHPVKRLTDERIHAAELWLSLAGSEEGRISKTSTEEGGRGREAGVRGGSWVAESQPYQPTIRPNAKERKEKAERML